MSRIASIGTGRPLAMSANCSTPPGRSTRWISSNTARLSAHRLMTPLEMTTSAQPSSTGSCSANPWRNSTWDSPSDVGGGGGLGEHLGGHVDPDDGTVGSDVVGGDEAVEPGAGADVDHPFTGLDRAQRERVADPGEGLHGPVGQRVDDRRVVAEPGGEWSSGVEVVGGVGLDGDGAVLLAVPARAALGCRRWLCRVMVGQLLVADGGWVSYMRTITTTPEAAVSAATA